jgi:uncharacterized protein YggE
MRCGSPWKTRWRARVRLRPVLVRSSAHRAHRREPQMGPPVYAVQKMTMTAAAGPETPISPGEIEVRAQVALTVSIR